MSDCFRSGKEPRLNCGAVSVLHPGDFHQTVVVLAFDQPGCMEVSGSSYHNLRSNHLVLYGLNTEKSMTEREGADAGDQGE